MIIWTGRGIITLMIWAAIYFLLFEDTSDENTGAAYAFLVSSPFVWLLGRYWNRMRIEVNPDTQRETAYRHSHSLFWIPMQYWGGLYIAIGAGLLIFG